MAYTNQPDPETEINLSSAKKGKKKRPTQRTLEMLREEGTTAQVVERWQMIPGHPGGGVRQDLFGFIDVIAIQGDVTLGIQCCADSGHSAHVSKCKAEPRCAEWLKGRDRKVEIHSWGLRGGKGKPKRWKLRIAQLTYDFKAGEVVVAYDYQKQKQLSLL